MKNARINTDQRFNLSLKAGGALIDMTSIDVLSLYMYCNPQKARDGAIKHSVSTSDAKVLEMTWPADVQSYLGSHSVHGTIRFARAVASFDIPAVNVVSRTSEADISTDTIVLEAPVGTEDLTATITIQGMGPQGPQGPKGDKMTYADLTQEDKEDLYEGGASLIKPLLDTKQNVLTDTDGSYGQRVAELETGKANLQHHHTVADITDFPELYYDATAFFASGAYPSDKYEELLDAVKAKKTVYATLNEEGNISYVFFTSLANSDASSSRVLLTTIFVDGSYLYLNTFVLQQSGMTRLQENITGKANKATTLAGYGIGDAYTKSEVDTALEGKQDTLTPGNGISIEGGVIGVTAITESESQPDTSLWLNPSEDEETDVTYNRSQIDAMLGAKQDALTLTVKDNGNIVLSNIQGQSKEFMPATPSGDPMHYAYVAAGAEYNDTGADIIKTTPWADLADDDADKTVIHKAGYWYLNGLGDITTDEMKLIFNETKDYVVRAGSFANSSQRTCLPLKGVSVFIDCSGLANGSKSQVLVSNGYYPSYGIIFRGTPNMKHICGKVRMDRLSSTTFSFNEFQNLKTILLFKINQSNNLGSAKILSSKSILYMIQNEAATSAITITLHADAYARAMANADIVAALQAHPNVSLASA